MHATDSIDSIDTSIVDWIWDGRVKAMFNYTDDDLATLARLLLRPCPFCGAKPGQWCRKRTTGEEIVGLDEQHVARRDLYRPPCP
jgi:hypothetical protein